MSTDTKQLEFDSHKYAALVYSHEGTIAYRFESDTPSEIKSDAEIAQGTLKSEARQCGGNPDLVIWESYTRDRDVRKLVEDAYAKGLADGKAGQ